MWHLLVIACVLVPIGVGLSEARMEPETRKCEDTGGDWPRRALEGNRRNDLAAHIGSGTTCLEYKGHIVSVAFSPDGKLVAAGVETGSTEQRHRILLWDRSTGRIVKECAGHKNRIGVLVFCDKGQVLASASDDGTARLWNITTGEELHQFRIGNSRSALAYSPNLRSLVSSDDEHVMKLWDIDTGKEKQRFKAHSSPVVSVVFSPDAKALISADDSGCVHIWDVMNGDCVYRFSVTATYLNRLILAPDGKRLLIGTKLGEISLWDVATGEELWRIPGHEWRVEALAWSLNSKTVASAGAEGTVCLWDVTTGAEMRALRGYEHDVTSIAFSPDGSTLASGSFHHRVRLWRIAEDGEKPLSLGHRGWINCVAFSADSTLVACGSDDESISIWHVPSARSVVRIRADHGRVLSVSFSPDGKLLASGHWDGSVRVWDVASGAVVQKINEHTASVSFVAFSPDGKLVAAMSRSRLTVSSLNSDGRSQVLLNKPNVPDGVDFQTIAFSSDGTLLVCACTRNAVYAWQIASGKSAVCLQLEGQYFSRGALTSNGSTLVSLSGERTVGLWDVITGKKTREIKIDRFLADREGSATDVVIPSPDSRLLALEYDDGAVCVWETISGNLVRALGIQRSPVGTLAFSGDMRILAVGSVDFTVQLYDITGFTERGALPALELNPDALSGLWSDLSLEDAQKANEAIWKLVAGEKRAVPFLGSRLQPVVPVDRETIMPLISGLESEDFTTREKSFKDLEKFREGAEPFLRKALETRLSAEGRERVNRLLDKLKPSSSETLLQVRAIQVLEYVGTKEAFSVLEKLAEGIPEARLTKEAKVAKERVANRLASRSKK